MVHDLELAGHLVRSPQRDRARLRELVFEVADTGTQRFLVRAVLGAELEFAFLEAIERCETLFGVSRRDRAVEDEPPDPALVGRSIGRSSNKRCSRPRETLASARRSATASWPLVSARRMRHARLGQ